ncbi:hypothetical protein B5X24_HaOG203831 [Helicoverpa armigera]|nr:hypothetical protein B5X24_HaOG203831 [Helicoverpa armigera]
MAPSDVIVMRIFVLFCVLSVVAGDPQYGYRGMNDDYDFYGRHGAFPPAIRPQPPGTSPRRHSKPASRNEPFRSEGVVSAPMMIRYHAVASEKVKNVPKQPKYWPKANNRKTGKPSGKRNKQSSRKTHKRGHRKPHYG